MKIDKRLNLVIEVEREDGGVMHVHHMPVSREVFEQNFELLSRSILSLYAQEMTPAACSRMVYYKIKQLAEEVPAFKTRGTALLLEIWRLTNVLVPTDRGFETLPFDMVMKDRSIMSEDDVAEVQNYICFFTAASWVHNREETKGMYEVLTEHGARITSSDVTAYASSLATSKPPENTGGKETERRSYVPS